VTNPDGKLPANVVTYGYQGTPMALDIAALQYLYGANMDYHSGYDKYILPEAGNVFYRCIWDAGGGDQIRNTSDRPSTIDLRPATLTNTPGGGGFVSSIKNVDGGFTIAHGVIIESAYGGSAADKLIGNGTGNFLSGEAGNDTISGGGGADRIQGGAGADRLFGGSEDDMFIFRAVWESTGRGDTIAGFDQGADRIRVREIDANTTIGSNEAFVFNGEGALTGEAGEIRFGKNAAYNVTVIRFDDDGDGVADMVIKLNGQINLTADDFIL
jgi:serralysin